MLAREVMLNYQANMEGVDRVPLIDTQSPAKIANQDYGFAVFAPYAETVTKVLDAALKRDQPFACLVPISLVNKAPSSEQVRDRLQAAAKIALLDPQMV